MGFFEIIGFQFVIKDFVVQQFEVAFRCESSCYE